LPERPRRLPAIRGFFFSPSLEGGLELFELSCPSCRRRSATSACSTAIWRVSEAINSSTSAGRFIPPLIQILSPTSPKFLSSKQNSPKQWYFGLTPPWELLAGTKRRLTPCSRMIDPIEVVLAPTVIERALSIFGSFKDRARVDLVQARKALTPHVFDLISSGRQMRSSWWYLR
jgi:hypothetical protein